MMAVDQMAGMGGPVPGPGMGPGAGPGPGPGPQAGPPMGGRGGAQQAVQMVSEATKLFRMAMASDPGLHVLQPDLEKMVLKVAKYYGYEQEVKLSMQRAREQERAGGAPPMGGAPPIGGGGGPAGPPPA